MEVTVARKKAGSPAITLQIKNPSSEISVDIILTLKVQQSWPLTTQGGFKIEQWLGTKVRRDLKFRSLYLVAKQNKREKVLRGTSNMDNNKLWNTFSTTWSLTSAIERVSWSCLCIQIAYSAFETPHPGYIQLRQTKSLFTASDLWYCLSWAEM